MYFTKITCTLSIDNFLFGSGGLSKCEGTSQEQALQNQAIRKTITEREDVKSLYEVYGSGYTKMHSSI